MTAESGSRMLTVLRPQSRPGQPAANWWGGLLRDAFDHDKGRKNCNLGVPSSTGFFGDFLQCFFFFFFLFSRITVQFNKEMALKNP